MLMVFLPQILFVPVIQRAINRRASSRVRVRRTVSVNIAEEPVGQVSAAQLDRINLGSS